MNREDLQSQITTHNRRLQFLKERQAAEGIKTDPAVRIEIEDIEAKLEALHKQLDALDDVSTSPTPTTFIANAPYGLETTLVGREDERLLLDDWFYHDADRPLLAVIGLGGMGKSALTWDWLQKLMTKKQAPPLVVWWSFYETDGTMDNLMTRLLEHFGDEPSQFHSLRAKADRVIAHLRQNPALLVLDGAERLLRAYSSLGAAYQGDEDDPAQRDQARQCTDPVTGRLLLWLAQPGHNSFRMTVGQRFGIVSRLP